MEKEREWLIYGHSRGVKERDKVLGLVRYRKSIAKPGVLRRVKQLYSKKHLNKSYVITKVKIAD